MAHNNKYTPAAEVSLTTGLYYCFSCHATYTLPKLVMEVGQMSFHEALRLIGEPDDSVELILEEKPVPVYDQQELISYHQNVWGRGSAYFNKRGIRDETITLMQLGYSSKMDAVIIPIHDILGKALGYVGRSIEGKQFKNSAHLPRSSTLFNIHRAWISSSVYVVESAMDAIRLHQIGVPAVASLGSTIANTQIDLLKRSFDQVIVIPDQDAAGMEMVRKIKSMIKDIQVIKMDDIGDYDDEGLTQALGHGRLMPQQR